MDALVYGDVDSTVDRIDGFVADFDKRPALLAPFHMEKPPAGRSEHYCMYQGCKSWGSFGFDKRYVLEWYCGEHKAKGESRWTL